MSTACITALAVVLLVCEPAAYAAGVTIGGFGGVNIPIVQDDAGQGLLYGIRFKLADELPVTVEPYLSFISEGDVSHSEEGIDFTIDGGSIQSLGIDFSLGGYREEPGANVYFVAGVGTYSREPGQEYREKETRFGFDFGLGLLWKMTSMFDIDLSGRLITFILEEGGSRKSAGLTAGLNYYFMQ